MPFKQKWTSCSVCNLHVSRYKKVHIRGIFIYIKWQVCCKNCVVNENRLALVNGKVCLNISKQLLRSYNFIYIFLGIVCRNIRMVNGSLKYSKLKEMFTSFITSSAYSVSEKLKLAIETQILYGVA